jgi:hypothetical protein
MAERIASRAGRLNFGWLILLAAASFLLTIFLPLGLILIGVTLGLGGVIGGLTTSDPARSHIYARVAMAGSALLLGPAIYLALAVLQG